MDRTVDRAVLAGIGLVLAVIVISAGLAYRNTSQLDEDARWVAHTHKVIELTDDVLLALVDAETGERGFVITGQEEFLQPYNAALNRLDEKVKRLKEETTDNEHQQANIRNLEAKIRPRVALLTQTIELRRRSADEASKFTASGKGKRQMDAIRALVAEMKQQEGELLKDREGRSKQEYRVAVATGLASAVAGLASVGAFVWLLRRSLAARRRAAAAVEEHREWLRVTLASVGDAVIATDTRGHVVMLNPVAERLTGWTQPDAEGQPLEAVFRIVNEHTRQAVESPAMRALREGTVVGLANHTVLIAKGGDERLIDDSAAPICDGQGRVAGVVLIFRDVTERRAAEAALRQAEALLDAVVNHAPACIFAKDRQGRYLLANLALARLVGREQSEFRGRTDYDFFPREVAEQFGKDDAAIIGTGQARTYEESFVRDGVLRTYLTVKFPLRDEMGQVFAACAVATDITELKQAQMALKASEERFRGLMEQAPFSVQVFSPDGRTVRVNRAWEELWGVSADQITDYNVLHDPQLERKGIAPDLRRAFSGEAVEIPAIQYDPNETIPDRTRHSDPQRWVAAVAYPLKDDAGGVREVILVHQDITDRRRAEEALRESEHRFRQLADAMPQIVWSARPDGNIDYLNRRWAEFTGLPQTVSNDGWGQILHPDDGEPGTARWAASVRTGAPFEMEMRLLDRRERAYRWHLVRTVAVNDEFGQVVRWFGTATDIDEQKRSEQASRFLAAASAELASVVDPESTLQKVATLAIPSFADWSTVDLADGTDSLRRLAVAHQDSAKVALVHELMREYPPDPHNPRGAYAVLRSGRPQIVTEVTDDMLVQGAKDEHHLDLLRALGLKSYICAPLVVSGAALGVLTFATAESGRRYDADDLRVAEDLAHRAAIAIENTRLYQALRDADRRKDEFLATLAHELRNPLAPISNSLQILKMSPVDAAMTQQVREMIERQVHHLVRLVDDLLDVSRVMRGKIELRRESVELATVIARAVETVKPLIEAQRHDLQLAVTNESLLLDADPVRLAQVVGNLLANSTKYTEAQGHIWLTTRREGDQAVLSVRDDGIGIAPEMLPHVFELFVQADHSFAKAQGGLGIGLTLVKKLVELHGGSVEARSGGLGRGSEFIVRLPLNVRMQDVPDAGEPGPVAAATGHRLLVVDDNTDAALSLSLLLRLQGHEVRVAHDGPSALGVATEFRPDLVFLDIGMAGMDGYEVARRLRQTPGLERTVLVAMTGWGQPEDRRRSWEAGFDQHLVKPAEAKAVQGVLASLPGRDGPA